MTSQLPKAALLAALSACLAMLAGCGGSGGGTPQGRVRVINALTSTPNNANVDVNLNNGQQKLQSVPFNSVAPPTSTSPAVINSGTSVPVVVDQTGTTSVIANTNVNVTQGVDQVLLVTGKFGTTGSTAPEIVSLGVTDLSKPPVSNQARLYFVNAAVGSATAAFSVTVNGTAFSTGSDLNSIAYGAMSTAELPAIPESPNNTIGVTATVGTQTVGPTNFNVAGGNTYALVVTGQTTAAGATPPLTIELIQLH